MEHETTKWPWHLTNTDVIVRDPRTGVTGEWPVIGEPTISDRVVVTCQTEDGGEGVFTYEASQRAVVRTQATYTVAPLLTAEQREQALKAMADDACAKDNHDKLLRFAALVLAGWPELFDAAYTRSERHHEHTVTVERRPA